VLPVMIERCSLPLRIARMQVIDATTNDDKALEACVAELRRTKATASAPAPSAQSHPGPIPDAEVELVAQILVRYLGPIATVLARRESKVSLTIEELGQRLAGFIPVESERHEFLRKLPK